MPPAPPPPEQSLPPAPPPPTRSKRAVAPSGTVNVPSARNVTTVDESYRMFVVTLEPVIVTDAGASAACEEFTTRKRALAKTAKRPH